MKTSLCRFACLALALEPTGLWAQQVAPAVGGSALGLPAAAAAAGAVPLPPAADYGRMTGALGRSQLDPGPIKRMWLVYRSPADLAVIEASLAKVKASNPGVEVLAYAADQVLAKKEGGYDASPEARRALSDRLAKEGAEFVLSTDQDLYEQFRGLRDSNLARRIPMGFAGRKFVSVDKPRASLDPAALSDPKAYPAQRYLWLGDPAGAPRRAIAGMEGVRQSLEGAVRAGEAEPHGDEFPKFVRVLMNGMVRLAGQNDPKDVAKLRKQAHRLAGYLEAERIDVIATDDPKATQVLGLMKRMGYHKSVPVVWTGKAEPIDPTAIHLSVGDVEEAFERARGVDTLPENFMEMGGVSAEGYVGAVQKAVDSALGGGPTGGRFDVHFLMTNGNGVGRRGDANPFGHFGMAVTDEKGKTLVWTVQYNNGGSFTGGLGEGKQLTLAEYLYGLWYLPGAVGQAVPLSEAAVSNVFDFVVRGLDEAQVEEMRRKAAEINARHLRGRDDYHFFNFGGQTNCISLVTQILRAAGFRVPETGTQDPAGQAYNMVQELARSLLSGRLSPNDVGMVVFERPAHAGPAHYRIANTALASPLMSRSKPWQKMSLWEKIGRVLCFPRHFVEALRVPAFLEGFAGFASHRVVVGPNSRKAEVVENAQSPLLKLRGAASTVARLRRERVPLLEALAAVEERIIAVLGFEGWQENPAQRVEEEANGGRLDAAARARLEADLAEHDRLAVDLALNRIDEQIELRRIDFLKVRVVDPTGRYGARLEPLRDAYGDINAFRRGLAEKRRLLTPAELDQLDGLNAFVETELEAVKLRLLKDAGPAIPQSIKMILGQIDRETLEDLRARSGGGGKGKDGKGK
ncbi:MAG: hypothetical protein HY553_08305 [Elusimicrobia bacterium]|nr:hypothetical protein [Elusimicrobiota bacterium]